MINVRCSSGFTLLEVMIATVILVLALVGTLGLFSRSLARSEECIDFTVAQYELERQMEQIRSLAYTDSLTNQGIKEIYTNGGNLRETQFAVNNLTAVTNLPAMGVIYANELPGAADQLMRVKVAVCYQQKNRIIGEDQNLDGRLDSGEDVNGNGELDSPCQAEMVVVNQEM